MPSTHTADFQAAALKATDLEAVEKINVGLETELARKQLNIIADAPEIRIQDKTGSAPEVNATTMAIVADGGTTHFRAGVDTFAEGTETKGNVKFQSSTGATTHAEIVGSSGKLQLQDGGLGLKLGSNVSVTGTSKVIQEITGPHARESAVLKKYPEVAFADGKFDTTDNENVSTYWAGHSTVFQGGYSVKTSHHSTDDGGQFGWNAFDDNPETIWKIAEDYDTSGNYDYGFTNVQSRLTDTNSTNHDGDHVIMGSPNKLKIAKVSVTCKSSDRRVVNYSVLGSDSTGTTGWTLLDSGSFAAQDANIATITSPTTHFKYHAFVVRSITPGVNGQRFQINSIYYYGYEDVGAGDDSVDTTVKSVYNAPDLTSAALYIDGKKSGSTPTDYGGSSITVTDNGTWDSSDNTWSLSGATTSNLVSADLGFVGDQPHSVSAWVKADRLNGSGLFHVGTADGAGDAASRVGFLDDSHISYGGADHFFSNSEWHNVTYTYNGEGSDKRLYLDGRLVDTAKNEDTFGEFPPFAMSNYSQYGYTVSASSAYTGYEVYEAFDDIYFASASAAYFSTSAIRYNTTTGAFLSGNVVAPYLTTVSGTVYNGEWIQMDFPHKLVLNSVEFYPHSGWYGRIPYNGVVAGSNDGGVSWQAIKVFSGFAVTATSWHSMILNSNKGYKSVRIVATAINSSGQNGYIGIDNTRFFGHRENDVVRFPDSVNVLKYPHVAMTGQPGTAQNVSDLHHAQRGYEVTASSVYVDNASNPYQPWRAFDSDNGAGWFSRGLTGLYGGTDNAYGSAATANLGTDSGGSATHGGEWLKLKLPRKLVLNRIVMYSSGSEAPEDFTLYGSNDGSSWTEILSETGLGPTTSGGTYTPSSTPSAYRYFGLVIKKTVSRDNYTGIRELKLYGTEEDLDVVARVGDGFDGKIRNLRVFSTALSDARVQEIFDADKDEFGLAKSSVSVHRGHLGVGTDTPEAALTVMDEVAELEEFPPSAMTAEETYIEGHGVFGLHHSGYNASGPIIRAFNKKAPFGDFWYSNTSIYQGTGNLYSGSAISPNGVAGEWMYMTLPYHVDMKYLEITARNGEENSAPNTAIIFGSADGGVTWEQVGGWSGKTTSNHWLGSGVPSPPFTINSTKPLNAIGFVVTHGNSWYAFTLGEIRFFGARERGASTLHNGELSLTRNLTVPRIGPPLDADDTPRRDRLVVEYNTSTNPMENGVVKDTSGRGLDGRIRNAGTTYDSTGKWFQCTASDGSQWIDTRIDSGGSRLSEGISGSIWVNQKYFDTSTKNSFIWSVGDRSGTGNNREIAITYNAVGQTLKSYYVSFNGGSGNLNVYHTSQTPFDVWTHVGMTYDGTTVKLYINGVYSASNTITDVNIPETNCFLRLNGDVVSANSTHQGTPMNLSNFKLYDVALTADEVKRLYDMGRCDEGHHTTHVYKSKLQMRGENLVIEPCIRGFYEEGRWTPLIGGHTSGRKTPNSANYGWFIRVGNMVTIGGTVGWDGGDSTLNGHIVLDGIPYPSRSTTNARAAMSFGVVGSNGITTGSGYNVLRLVLDPGYPYIWFIQANEHGSTTVTYNHNPGVASSGYIYGIGGSYMI